jgi:hypothetical protein
MKNFKILLILLLFCNSSSAQNFEYGKVTPQELAEKYHPSDTAAVAAFLFNKAKTSFINSSMHQTECTLRIKIYKKEGLNWANFEVPYYVGWKNLMDDSVKFSDCNTYNLVNGKVEKTKLTGEGSFKESINSDWRKVIITMPNVKVGSVIEIKYYLKSENNITLPKFDFQYAIPVNFSQYVTEIPDYYIYNVILNGYLQIHSDVVVGAISKNIKSTYTIYNVPAIVEEQYVDNINNYKSSLEHELKSTRYQGEYGNFAATWEGVAKTVYKDDRFGKELGTLNYFEKEFEGSFSERTSNKSRLAEILKYVQNRMTWNGKYGYFAEKGVKRAFVEQTGNVADVNFILITLLNFSGFKASPVLVSTRDNGLAVFPSRTAFNYVVAGVELDDTIYLLDATDKNSLVNVLPFRTLNGSGRLIINDQTVTEVVLNPTTLSKFVTMITADIKLDGSVQGQFKSYASDHNAVNFRSNYQEFTSDKHIERLERKYPFVRIDNYELENKTDSEKTLNENFDFEDSNSIEIIDDKMYWSPLMFLKPIYNPFIKENRECPINFGYPFQNKHTYTLTIPEGYEVENLPKSVNFALENDLGSFKYFIQNTTNEIQLFVTVEFSQAIINQNNYEAFRVFYQTMFDKQQEKVILKKK